MHTLSFLPFCTTRTLAAILGLCFSACVSAQAPTQAQEPTLEDTLKQCEELRMPAFQARLEQCSKHPVCKQVFDMRSNCTARLKFTEHLRFPTGAVTPQSIWDAALPEAARAHETHAAWRDTIALMNEGLKSFTGRIYLSGRQADRGAGFVTPSPGPSIDGAGYFFYNSGEMIRGEFKNSMLDGPAENVKPDGTRVIGMFVRNSRNGVMIVGLPSGVFVQGDFRDGQLAQGKAFRKDGTLHSQGLWAPGLQLTLGERYDATGKTSIGTVNRLSEDSPGEKSAAEQSCRAKLKVYDREQTEKSAANPNKDTLSRARQIMSAAKARESWLRVACSDWNLHMRLVWDAQIHFENARQICTIVSGKECALD